MTIRFVLRFHALAVGEMRCSQRRTFIWPACAMSLEHENCSRLRDASAWSMGADRSLIDTPLLA